jgi:hypothetical protein
MSPQLAGVVYYTGRLLQVVAMWVLLVDIFMAGPMGPQPNPFYVGVGLFLAGWLLIRTSSNRG